MRPYGSFSEFYQFIGRGIRAIRHPALAGRVTAADQYLDVVFHAELGLDDHVETIYRENDMDPSTVHDHPPDSNPARDAGDLPGTTGTNTAERAEAFVLFERGTIEARVVHDQARVEARRTEREREAFMQRYAAYVATTTKPVSFEEWEHIVRTLGE